MRYIIYTRVSSRKQAVENQIEECLEYIKKIIKPGDEIIQFEEPDRSTFHKMARRYRLQDMLKSLKKGDHLIVYKVDRLARHPQELINIYFEIKQKGVKISGVRDTNLTDEMICIYAFVACSERSNIQKRTLDKLDSKKRKKERTGSVAYGYRLDETKLQTERKDVPSFEKPYLLIPDEKEQQNLNIMVDMRSNGFSYQQIVNRLESIGAKNRLGNPFQKMTIYQILKRLEKNNCDQLAKSC